MTRRKSPSALSSAAPSTLPAETTASKVQEHLKRLSPLTPVLVKDLYDALESESRSSIRSALYSACAGTPVAKRNGTEVFHAIRLPVILRDTKQEEVFLSLRGVPRARLMADLDTDGQIKSIIEKLKSKYGEETISYWAGSAQKRSVDIARTSMGKARRRDKMCLVCKVLRDRFNVPFEPSETKACHIVSRRSSFWLALHKVDQEVGNIFCDRGVGRLKELLREDELHSEKDAIVLLCESHNEVLLRSLKSAVEPAR